jgi:TonB family protein
VNAGRRYGVALVAGVALTGLLAWAVVATYYPVRPRLLCTMPLGTGEVAAYFGYFSEAEVPLDVPLGEENLVSAFARVEAPVTRFVPGSSGSWPDAAFVATFRPQDVPPGERLSWTLGPRTVRLSDDTPRCAIPAMKEVPEDVAWVKPKPEPPPEPKPEPPPEPKLEPKPEPPPEPPPAEKRPPRTKTDKPQQAATPPKPEAPVALALTGLTNLDGGMAIQKGEFDSLGDAAVEATRETTAPREGGRPDGTAGGTGDGPAREPKRVAARVKVRPKGQWPDDAPPRAGAVLVRLSLLVGVDGKVKQVRVVRKAGEAFDREAVEVGMKALFEPATVDGEPVESWVPWDVEFTPETW